jgi:hypothetical protein
MTMNYGNLGKRLTQKQMKNLIGGIAWPDFRDFQCQKGLGPLRPGGCTSVSGAGAACCQRKYGSGHLPVWGPFGCPYEVC